MTPGSVPKRESPAQKQPMPKVARLLFTSPNWPGILLYGQTLLLSEIGYVNDKPYWYDVMIEQLLARTARTRYGNIAIITWQNSNILADTGAVLLSRTIPDIVQNFTRRRTRCHALRYLHDCRRGTIQRAASGQERETRPRKTRERGGMSMRRDALSARASSRDYHVQQTLHVSRRSERPFDAGAARQARVLPHGMKVESNLEIDRALICEESDDRTILSIAGVVISSEFIGRRHRRTSSRYSIAITAILLLIIRQSHS